jgi:hypothetical protein
MENADMDPKMQNGQDSSLARGGPPSKTEEARKKEIDSFDTQDIPAFLISSEKLLSFLKSEFPGKFHCFVRYIYLDPHGRTNTDTVLDDARYISFKGA